MKISGPVSMCRLNLADRRTLLLFGDEHLSNKGLCKTDGMPIEQFVRQKGVDVLVESPWFPPAEVPVFVHNPRRPLEAVIAELHSDRYAKRRTVTPIDVRTEYILENLQYASLMLQGMRPVHQDLHAMLQAADLRRVYQCFLRSDDLIHDLRRAGLFLRRGPKEHLIRKHLMRLASDERKAVERYFEHELSIIMREHKLLKAVLFACNILMVDVFAIIKVLLSKRFRIIVVAGYGHVCCLISAFTKHFSASITFRSPRTNRRSAQFRCIAIPK